MDPGRSLSDDESHYTYKPSKESHIVIISYPFPSSDEKPQSTFVGETISDSITITNTTSKPLHLLSVKINGSEPENSFTLSTTKPPTADDDDVERLRVFMEAATLEEDRVLKTDKPLTIWLSCKPKEIGLHTASISFNIGEEIIKRHVTLLAENKISHSLSSSKPYKQSTRKKKNIVDMAENFVVGVRPLKGSNGRFRCRLPQYRIPADIREMINKGQINGAVSEGLSFENYGSFFKNLLAMEEMKMEEDMGAYNMECAAMKTGKRNDLLSLKVEGLDEQRPSLVIGDFVIVKVVNGDENSKSAHQGYIHQVGTKEIYLKFDKKFHQSHKEGNLYNVQFTYNRSGIRRLYDAVKAAEKLDKNFLFPCEKRKFNMKQVSKKLVPISCKLDDKQVRAVKTILSHSGGLPYVIHGPPGTGKTITLVEAMLQIYCAKQKARMLVCAPSNCAADHILELLINQESVQIKDDILRLNAYTRPFDDVDPKHVDYCCFEDYVFSCPSLEELAQYRIIISTNTSTYLLYSEGLGRGHFSYFFLDEAGRALEPETMVPLSHLYSENSVVVLAGDPMQLGPVVFSRDAERYGLGTSYLERLFKCDLYHDGDRHFMTKLVRNYRSHKAILRLPSELFYGGELIPCKEGASFLTSLEDVLFPNKEFPLLFIGIEGRDEREGNNPSWFNRIEASKVVGIIEVLYERGLNEEDIGVITPYRQQVNKIRGALESVGVANVKIGSVEQFQGQEREVIIISTVRSNMKHKKFDRVHSLGFLSNPKRFNVAITRAKSLLVVIGNPHILSKDLNWNKLLWYCVDNGSYNGCSLPAREDFTAENSAETGHTGAQDLKDNSQPSGGNRNKGGDGWRPDEDQWNGNWNEGGYGRPYEYRCNGNGDEGGDRWLPVEDQWAVEEPPYQGASTSVRWGSQNDRYQSYDVPWE